MKTTSQSPIHFSPVMQNLKTSPTLAINERVQELWAEGEQVYHFGFGESRFPVHPKMQAALAANAHQKSYLPGRGLPALREQIAAFYSVQLGMAVSSEQVIVGPGSKSLMYALRMALDGALILPTPAWVSYAPQSHLLNRPVYRIPASPRDGYALTMDAVQETVEQVAEEAKILLITSPNNPTGHMFEAAFLSELADFCRQEGIVVLSDEIYSLVPHGQKPHISLVRYYPEGTIVLGGLSKYLSLGGWRLGVGILPKSEDGRILMQNLHAIASEIWSTPTAPVQYAALTAYSDDPDIANYIAECAAIHAARTQHLWSWLVELGISCPQPEGGFYLISNFDRWREPLAQRDVHTSLDLAKYLLDNYHIATLPGSAFGTPERDLSLRIATSYVDMETDEAAEKILEVWRQEATSSTREGEQFMTQNHPHMAAAISRFQQFIQDLEV
ncbi:MAG: aminotransferase class I/II-fold pyridoxal phosphate-dependent enzyme [Chloroflexi bacterium]|nr:aminotransferase class I/II-fold pyridoxal phosphate-dependent enzyme [Chloroflexota bacterium]